MLKIAAKFSAALVYSAVAGFSCQIPCVFIHVYRVPADLESLGINLVRESRGILLLVREK